MRFHSSALLIPWSRPESSSSRAAAPAKRLTITTAAMTALCVSAWCSAQICTPTETAQYEMRFDATWTAKTHPQDYPPNPHFSPLVGGAHSDEVYFWNIGDLATDGIESMAETGSTTLLKQEVQAAINAGFAREMILGGGVGKPPASTSLTFTVSRDHPLATIVTMIAPSPDWFVGVSGLDLLATGNWANEIVVDLYPYDAGTDSGITYLSNNFDTNPPDPIAEIMGYPFLNGDEVLPLGTFTFTRTDAPCLELCIDQLVSCNPSTFSVDNGTPGAQVAVLYGLQPGQYTDNIAGWCVDFGFKVNNPLKRIVAQGKFDNNGHFEKVRPIACKYAGLSFLFQAAERHTCPDACMSNVVEATVQ